MTLVARELAAIAFFVIVGWVALWPSRRRVGAWTYHLAALPTGLLAAPLAGAVSTLTGRPLDALSAAGGGLALVAAFWAVQYVAVGRRPAAGANVGPLSYVAATGVLGVLGSVLGLARYTGTNYDSIISFWPLGVELSRTGAFSVPMLSSRSPLIPTMNAVHIVFGSDWAYVIYPLLAATVAFWLVWTLWAGPLAGASRRTKLLVGGGALGFLVLEPSFLFHSFLVHSHMISAVYLLMSITCLGMARRPDASEETGDVAGVYLMLAGAFAAGLALTRPDGLAYQFVPVAVAISVLTLSKVRWRSVVAFFGPLLFIVLGVHAAAYAHLGMWKATKLGGRTALAILVVLVLSAAGPWIVELLGRVVPIRITGERFLGILVSVAAVLMLGVFALKWSGASLALANTRINLFQGAGGYNYLWYALVILLVISIFTRDALRIGSWTRPAFLAIALFFVIAGLVHGTSHEGRIGVGDSFNRVVFEVVPLIVWYVAAVVARILGPTTAAEKP